ncbi:pleiotropic regulatory protein RsmS [Vibrio mexicanus]|uniref:pleiotropic regulatory protein RsmS n=1 Tax=Vibrio mexicanus TaxID=1004326 RepID=UPI00063CAD53|nr:pleiotropic regulatory protein RsmS [Vibrio mexicanus]
MQDTPSQTESVDQPVQSSPLDNAPDEIKLAVDLIYLLESNEVDPKVALEAIKIVQSDLEQKINS